MDAPPDLPRIPLTNRAARRSLAWRLAWSAVGACILSVVTLAMVDRLFPKTMNGFARAPVRGEERPAERQDRLPAVAPEPPAALAAPTPGRRSKRKNAEAERKPEALVSFEQTPEEAPAAPASGGEAPSKPYFQLLTWIKSIGGGGALGNRFRTLNHPRRAPSQPPRGPSAGGGPDPSRAVVYPLGGGAPSDGGAVSPPPSASRLRDRPVPLEWGEASGSPVLVKKMRNPDAQGFWAPDITRGSEVSPDELRQIRAEDQRIRSRLEFEILMLRMGGGSVIIVLWVALLLFASGIAQRMPRPWGAEVAQSDVETKSGKRR